MDAANATNMHRPALQARRGVLGYGRKNLDLRMTSSMSPTSGLGAAIVAIQARGFVSWRMEGKKSRILGSLGRHKF